MPPRLTKIDELTRSDHFHIAEDDDCYYLREYTAGGGYAYSSTNQLISNLKKPVDRRGRPEYRHKERAIVVAAQELRATLNPDWLAQATLVPIPPSACPTDCLYDDRMTQILRQAVAGIHGADIRDLVTTRESMTPAHVSSVRPTVDELIQNYEINEALAKPEPVSLGIVDDLLTAGSHFRAAKSILSSRFPSVPIVGIFIARRIFPPSEQVRVIEI